METSILFLYCFAWAFLAVLPPGIININAAKISVSQGIKRGMIFNSGACTVIALQAATAIIIAEFLNLTSDELNTIKKIGVAIFFFLGIYFFITARVKTKPKEITVERKRGVYAKGLLFSALNVFPIPFYSFVCTTLTTSGNFNFSTIHVITFITAIVIGSFIAISAYIFLFKRVKNQANFNRNANYTLSVIILALAIYTLINL